MLRSKPQKLPKSKGDELQNQFKKWKKKNKLPLVLTLWFTDLLLELELRDSSYSEGQCRPNAQHSIAAVWMS